MNYIFKHLTVRLILGPTCREDGEIEGRGEQVLVIDDEESV